MSKTLLLVRHAKSDWSYPHLRDIDRPLNDRGLRDAPAMAAHLQKLGIQPSLIVSSPAVRALSTAAIFKATLDVDGEDFLVRDEIYEAGTPALMRVVQHLPMSAELVLMFGHNPGFTMFANLFPQGNFDNIPTCGVVRLDADVQYWEDFGPDTARVTAHFFPKEVL